MMLSCWLMLLVAAGAAPGGPIVENGGFETVAAVRVGSDGRANGWRVGRPPQVPAGWTLNPAYPGELRLCGAATAELAHGGQHFVRITAAERDAHLYQMCQGLEPGRWYRVSAWVRGGAVALEFYEYFQSGKTGGQSVARTANAGPAWRLLRGYYRTPGDGYLRSALAVCVRGRQSADVDDVSVEPMARPPRAADAADVCLETDLVRLKISPQATLREFRSKPSGKDYAADAPLPIVQMVCDGVAVPAESAFRQGDLLHVRFVDPALSASLRIGGRRESLQLEVVDVRPADAEQLILEFPLRRLKTAAAAMNAMYDEQFGACLWGTAAGARQELIPHGRDVVGLSVGCTGPHGIVGARFVLTAAPRARFQAALIEAERGGRLPSPMLEGRWARDSRPVRRSYLFVVDAQESNIDKLIEYAKIGHFGTIMFLKDNWLSTHGHYQINTRNFPDGVESVRRAVTRIHAAGMAAGAHVYGPSISPNDPYVTPKPDDRLARVACPPLAAAVDAKRATLELAGLPKLPPYAPRNEAFPGFYVRIGDEIIRYQDVEAGPPPRLMGCQRGALGTKAAAHPAGSAVEGLLTMWNFFLVDPDSSLADELTGNFAAVFNACDFDMAYFDASDGIDDAYLDRRYYLDKLHLGFYRKLKKDVLYQTSNGTGAGLLWHLVPRSASADGHGDLKRYLDERLPGVLGMADNWTHADVGWYYMYDEVRPDQIEYVCAKTIGLDGSISIETSQAAMEKHPRARQMLEMVGRYEQCRMAGFFAESVKAQLRAPQRDFKLFGDGPSWTLLRAAYEEPRFVEALDGRQNVWTIRNDRAIACPLGVEIARGFRNVPTTDYEQPGALVVESFADMKPYQRSPYNRSERFFTLPDAVLSDAGAARAGVAMDLQRSADAPRAGETATAWTAHNSGQRGGWCATGRRFPQPLDLSRYEALGLWLDGDGEGENLRVQLRDTVGRVASWTVLVSFKGWRLCVFPLAGMHGFERAKTEYLVFWLQGLAGQRSVRAGLGGLRALPRLHAAPPLVRPTVIVNGRRLTLPLRMECGQALTSEGPGGVRFWPGGMQPGQTLETATTALALAPGANRVEFTAETAEGYPGDVNVLFYRLYPLP